MGVPKKGNKKRKENQKLEKKDNKPKKKVETKTNETTNHQNEDSKVDEFKCLKDMMKAKNLSGSPLVVGATMLENSLQLEKLLEKGHNPNESGTDKVPALHLAVKNKSIEIAVILVSKGADLAVMDENGDNLFLIAIGNKTWDEDTFFKFYNKLRNTENININHQNNVGNNIVHFTVKRHWGTLLNTLINDGVKFDAGNKKGVTPLMFATARNQHLMVQILMKNGARALAEDDRGCTAICFALANLVQKKIKPPFLCLDALTTKFGNKKNGPSWKNYIKRRLELLTSPSEERLSNIHEVANRVMLPVFGSFIKNIQSGIDILLELSVFSKIAEALDKYMDHREYVISLLSTYTEILRYCNTCVGCISSNIQEQFVIDSFIKAKGPNTCITVLLKYGCNTTTNMLQSALIPIFLACSYEGKAEEWLKENYTILISFYQQFIESCVINFNQISDETHIQQTKQKLKKFKSKFEELQKDCEISRKEDDGKLTDNSEEADKKYTTKHKRRKTKALKAKIDKIRRADMLERANNVKTLDKDDESQMEVKMEIIEKRIDDSNVENCLISEEYKDKNEVLENGKEDKIVDKPEVLQEDIQRTNQILEGIFKGFPYDKTNLNFPYNQELDRKATLWAKIIQLQLLLGDIIEKYESYWKMDRRLGYPDFLGANGDSSFPILQGSREQQLDKIGNILPLVEQKYISKLRENFHRILDIVMSMYNNKNMQYEVLLLRLEEALLNHNVRGEKILNDLPDENDPFVDFDEPKISCGVIGDRLKKYDYSPDVFKSYFTVKLNEKSNDIYLNDNFPKRLSEELEKSKKNTMKRMYEHLLQSFSSLDSDSSISSYEFKDEYPLRKMTNDDLTLVKAKFFTILANKIPENEAYKLPLLLSTKTKERRENEFKATFDIFESENYKSICTRWEGHIRSLQNFVRKQIIKKGEILLSAPDTRHHFILTSGGNFGDVELGLLKTGIPLAIKRVRQNYSVNMTLQNLITPLLDLEHRHVLPYIMCDYAGTQELFLISPLCEYNLGEYLMCLKCGVNHGDHLAIMYQNLLRQMLCGIQYLHTRNDPVVHGNLKPSNVLIDLHGCVRIAEFGIHKALYQTLRPSKSSVIWFSRETYERYQQHLVIDCTTYSDIQTAGMLVHFILTGGLHPFGIVTEDILENLIRGTPRLSVTGCELVDLLSWMLLYEENERPTIEQVLKHVYFWNIDKKWKFLLACAGITEEENIIAREMEQFHNALNILAIQNNVRGDWATIIREKYPFVPLDGILHHDTPVGVLKFLRIYTEQNNETPQNNFSKDLKRFILNAFPVLPLSLYRLIDNTDWLLHPAFIQFSKKEEFDIIGHD